MSLYPDIDADHFFELSLDLMTVAGFDGYFKRLNPTWSRTFGWSTDELMATPITAFVHPEDRIEVLSARSILKDGVPLVGLTNRYRCKDGSYRWLEWRSIAWRERGLVYAVARDVTDQKSAEQAKQRLEAQLKDAERMASIGRLAAGVAHEVNNPLSFVLANLSTAKDVLGVHDAGLDAAAAQSVREMLEDALVGADRVRGIVKRLSAHARFGEVRRAPSRVQVVMERAIEAAAQEVSRCARICAEYGETPLVDVDEDRLRELFRNLLVNAAASYAASSCAQPGNEIRVVTSMNDDGRVAIEIGDKGDGISAHALQRIFEPFSGTRSDGMLTGLGLAMCREIVNDLDGEITVTSEAGRGTTFRVLLRAEASVRTDR